MVLHLLVSVNTVHISTSRGVLVALTSWRITVHFAGITTPDALVDLELQVRVAHVEAKMVWVEHRTCRPTLADTRLAFSSKPHDSLDEFCVGDGFRTYRLPLPLGTL